MLRKSALILLLISYGLLFFYQEKNAAQAPARLGYPIPGIVQKTVLGYLRQLGGEMHFIKTAVFLGGHFTNYPDETYANDLAGNFKVMAELHPYFIDIYFLCESGLARIGPDWSRAANEILSMGMAVNPDKWVLPFFQSYNYNHILNEPRQAAEALKIASRIDGAPGWLEHLASIRAAQGGDILSGLIWLKAMLKTENDPASQNRYQQDIVYFEKALNVQKAIYNYRDTHGTFPTVLDDLIPELLPGLPDFNGHFHLEWSPPHLRLKRPDRRKPPA